jgi:hypothetical protein
MPNLTHLYGNEHRIITEDIRPSDSITASLDADQSAETDADAQAVVKDGVASATTAQRSVPKPAQLPSLQIKDYSRATAQGAKPADSLSGQVKAPAPVVGSSGHVKKSGHFFGLVGRH